MPFTKRSERFVKSVSSLSRFLLLDIKYKLDKLQDYKVTLLILCKKKHFFLMMKVIGWNVMRLFNS